MPDKPVDDSQMTQMAEDELVAVSGLSGGFEDLRDDIVADTPEDKSGADVNQEPAATPVESAESKTPVKDEPASDSGETGDKPPAEPEPLTPEQVSEQLLGLFDAATPEAALKRAGDQTAMVGKQSNEVGELRKAATETAIEHAKEMAAVNAKLETLTAMVGQGKPPDDVAPFITDPNAEPKAEVPALTAEQARQIAQEEAAKAGEAEKAARAEADAVTANDTAMRKVYGKTWDQLAVNRENMAKQTAATAGQVGDGQMSPPELYHLATIGKQYLEALRSGKAPGTTTTPTPTGGVGGAASAGDTPEPKEPTMDDLAEAEFKTVMGSPTF